MARHYSPPGTYEKIRKDVIEDPTWTPAEFRLAVYLAAKPDGWVIHVGSWPTAPAWVDAPSVTRWPACRRRGLVDDDAKDATRDKASGRYGARVARFRRDLIIALTWADESNAQVAPDDGDRMSGVTWENTVNAQVTPDNANPSPGTDLGKHGKRPGHTRQRESAPYREDGVRDDGKEMVTGAGVITGTTAPASANGDDPGRRALLVAADQVFTEHRAACDPRLSRTVIAQQTTYVAEWIVNGGHDPAVIAAALAAWSRRAVGAALKPASPTSRPSSNG